MDERYLLLLGLLMAQSQHGYSMPFWLNFMEQFGGMMALISIALLTWQMRRLDRAPSPQDRIRRWRLLNQAILGVGAGVAVTIFVVALRL